MPESAASEAAPLAVVLMGTGPFAVPAFEAIRAAGYPIRQVVTRPQRGGKSRRPPPPAPVRAWAEAHRLPLADPASINSPEGLQLVREAAADLFVVCDYGQILKQELLAVPPRGGINLHGSLLPAYRGAAPVQWAMRQGEQVTGVSVIHMTPRLDAGPVLVTRPLTIRDDETAGQLEARLADEGVEATLEALQTLATWDGTAPLGSSQDAVATSLAPRLQKQDGRIDWSQTGRQIDCHVRAMQPWPTAFTELPASPERPAIRLVVRQVASPLPDAALPEPPAAPGTVVIDLGLHVACGDGYLRLERLQPAGKREMSADDFLRGRPVPAGTRLA